MPNVGSEAFSAQDISLSERLTGASEPALKSLFQNHKMISFFPKDNYEWVLGQTLFRPYYYPNSQRNVDIPGTNTHVFDLEAPNNDLFC